MTEDINESRNPPSSNPLRILLDYAEIVRTNDRANPKFVTHLQAVRGAIRHNLVKGTIEYNDAMRTVSVMGIMAVQPYLAILDRDAYERRCGTRLTLVSPAGAGSPTSFEYHVIDIEGPTRPQPELQLQKLHF